MRSVMVDLSVNLIRQQDDPVPLSHFRQFFKPVFVHGRSCGIKRIVEDEQPRTVFIEVAEFL